MSLVHVLPAYALAPANHLAVVLWVELATIFIYCGWIREQAALLVFLSLVGHGGANYKIQ